MAVASIIQLKFLANLKKTQNFNSILVTSGDIKYLVHLNCKNIRNCEKKSLLS